VQALIDAFRSADARVKDLISKQQSLDAQLTENNMVKTELDALKEGEPVYKLQGKLLVLHEPADALDTVNRRIAMITGEMCAPARAPNRPKMKQGAPNRPKKKQLTRSRTATHKPAQRQTGKANCRGAAAGSKAAYRDRHGSARGRARGGRVRVTAVKKNTPQPLKFFFSSLGGP
jgi:hypothetical protein